MAATNWPTSNWPKDVPQDVTDYDKPLFSVLDDAARDYPNQVYTIFNDATRTYAQVKNTADRVASFLVSRGVKKGDRVAVFLPNLPHYPATVKSLTALEPNVGMASMAAKGRKK